MYYPLEQKQTTFLYFRKVPKSRCVFITIRDPKDKYTMSKAINWLKRYAAAMTIVSSPQGGRHFHILMALKKDAMWSPRCSKGVSFNIQYLGKKHRECPSPEEIQDSLKAQHYREVASLRISDRMNRRYPGCSIHFKIADMIKNYYRLKLARDNRLTAKNDHDAHILRVLNYLEKNYNENDFSDRIPREYHDYYVKFRN